MISTLIRLYPKGRRPGVTEADLDRASVRLGFDIPEQLRAFYRETNGLVVHERRLVLNDVETAVKYANAIARIDFVHNLGLLPLTESNDSNPYCLACTPLVGNRIIHIRHDDAPRLAFRNLDQFAAAVIDLALQPEWIIDDLALGYANDHTDRTTEDDAAADNIVEFRQSHQDEDDHLLSTALALYSRNRIDQIIALLEHDNMWIREDAATHLGNIGDVRAIKPLRKLAESQANRQDGRAAQAAIKKLDQILYSARDNGGTAQR
jgi:hypothetical protein